MIELDDKDEEINNEDEKVYNEVDADLKDISNRYDNISNSDYYKEKKIKNKKEYHSLLLPIKLLVIFSLLSLLISQFEYYGNNEYPGKAEAVKSLNHFQGPLLIFGKALMIGAIGGILGFVILIMKEIIKEDRKLFIPLLLPFIIAGIVLLLLLLGYLDSLNVFN